MRIKITTSSLGFEGIRPGMEFNVLAKSHSDPPSYIIDFALGASFGNSMRRDVLSDEYSEDKHQHGKYAWIKAHQCVVLDIKTNKEALSYLRED